MTNISRFAPVIRRALLLAGTLLAASPALADHMGPSGVGSGGGMSVFGPDTLDAGHGAAGFRLTYTRPERRTDAELEALAAEDIHAHNTDYNLNASLGAAYGISHHLTVSAELPYVRRDHLREGAAGGVERLGSVAGIGDMNLLAKYRLTEGDGPGVALIGGIKLPTGSTHRRSRDGERLETEHQPGTGSWDPIVGASASLPLGVVQLTASALYQLSGKGAQATRLGDRLQGGVALSHRFGERRARASRDAQPPSWRRARRAWRGAARVVGCVRGARRRVGRKAAGRRRGRASERRPLGLCRARTALQRGVGLDRGGGAGGAGRAAHPRIAPEQSLPADAVGRPGLLMSQGLMEPPLGLR